MFFLANLPKSFWHLSIAQVVHIINCLLSPLVHNNIPYFLLFNTTPSYETLKYFGCLAYASTIQQNRAKFDPRSTKCVFLGYQEGTIGYLLFNFSTKKCFASRNVSFYETQFHFAVTHDHNPLPPLPTKHYDTTDLEPPSYDNTLTSPTQLPNLFLLHNLLSQHPYLIHLTLHVPLRIQNLLLISTIINVTFSN